MTITIGEDCSDLTITSSYLDSENTLVEVFITRDCDSTLEWTQEYDVELSEITITPEDLDMESSLTTGVYYIKLVVTQSDGTIVPETVCRFISCDSNCLMLPTFKLAAEGDTEAIMRSLAYYALVNSANCSNCSCTTLCQLYTATHISACQETAINSITPHVNDCGCS